MCPSRDVVWKQTTGMCPPEKNFYDPVLEGNSENIIPVLNRYSGKLMVLMKIFEVALMNIPCPGIKKQMYIPVPEFLTENETLLAGRS